MADKSATEWTDATRIIDRDGRRIRLYWRKLPNRPGTQLRRLKRAEGLAWCRGCHAWRSREEVSDRGTCKPCTNAEDRHRYATNEKYRSERQAHRDKRKRGAERMPAEARNLLLELFDGRCAYCSRLATTFDHFHPITKGGRTEPGNMLPCCTSCNSRKRNKNPERFLAECGSVPPFTIEYLAMARVL